MTTDSSGSRADLSSADSREFDLKDTEELYRALVDQAPDAIFVSDHKFRFIEVNARGCEMSGYSREEVLHRSVFDFMVPEDVVANPLRLDELKQGKTVVNERRLKRKDGTAIPVEVTAKLLTDGRLQAIVRDVGPRERAEKERKKLDAALRYSERRFRALIEHSDDAIALFGADGAVLYASPSTTRVMGYEPEELLQRNMVEFIRPEYLESVSERLAESLRHPGVGIPTEAYVRNKDGEYRFVEGTFTNLLNEPSVGAIVNNYRDITERKQVEAALRDSENKFSKAFHSNPAMLVLTTLDGKTVDINQAYVDFVGLTREEILGKSTVDLQILSAEERERIAKLIQQTGGTVHGVEFGIRLLDGRLRHMLFSGDEISLAGVPHRLATLLDITDRKRAEEALRESEDQYRDLVDNMRDLVCTHDLEGRALFVNRASAELLGYEPDELLGRNLREILGSGTRHLFDDYIRTIQANGEASGLMLVRTRAGEPRIWEYHNTLRSDGVSGLTVRGLARDVTERKQAEVALRASRDQLRALSARVQTAREEEGTRIAREIHDELGGVLTSLKWDLEDCERLLSASTNGEPNASIRKKIPVMADLLDTTIDTVRRISSELRPGVLDDLGLVAAIEWQARQFRQRTGIECICDAELEEVELSREESTAIFRVFQEVLTNVIRHAQATRVEVRMSETNGEFVLEVKDNGRGITKAEKVNTRSLGLLGMHERVQLIGGTIEISGAKGQGTRVVVRLSLP